MDMTKRFLRSLTVLGALALLQGCSGDKLVDVHGVDEGVNFPAGELTYTFRETTRNGKPRVQNTIELGQAKGEAGFNQTVNANERIELNGTTINGLVNVKGEAAITARYLRVVQKHFLVNGRLILSYGFGLSQSDMAVDLQTNAQTAAAAQTYQGLNAAFGLRWMMTPELSAELHLTHNNYESGSFPFPSSEEYMNERLIQLCYTGIKPLGVCLGHRGWYSRYPVDNSPSEVDLEMSGPTATVQLNF